VFIQKFEKKTLSIFDAATLSVTYTKNIMIGMVNGLVKIFSGRAPADVSGPIGVAQMAGEVAQQGIMPFVKFLLSFLSINLGIMNLLPYLPWMEGTL